MAPPEFETTGSGISHASTGGFSNVAIPAGTTIWFNSEVRYSGLPSQVVHLYSNGGRITFSAGGVTYNLVVPDAVVTIDSRTTASTSFTNGVWQTGVPIQYAGQTFVSALAWVVPVNLPGSITNITWTTNLQSEVSFTLTWQWSAATYSSFTSDMSAVGVKPVDNQWINPYANSDTAGTPENYRNRLIPGARTGGGTNYIGVPVTMPAFTPDTPCAGVTCTPNAQCQTASSCDVPTGQCIGTNRPNGTACSDGNACTAVDSCQAGVCAGASPVVCTASDQCHVAGTCNPANGQCSNPSAANGVACSDGNACTAVDSCQAGVCTGASPVVCTASDQCHVAGTCNPANGQCSNPSAANGVTCNDGNGCTQTDTCQSGACVGANPVVCTAADQCHTAGTCSPATGSCSNPVRADYSSCSDGDACTQHDWCIQGVCSGRDPVVCPPAPNGCYAAPTCDQTSGLCQSYAPSANCCGNRLTEAGEQCDNGLQGHGCSMTCTIEPGYTCTGSSCSPICGDGICTLDETNETCPSDCMRRVAQVAAGAGQTCVLFEGGGIRCLGDNRHGTLGTGNSGNPDTLYASVQPEYVPLVRLGTGRSAARVELGEGQACALLDDGSVKCWGLLPGPTAERPLRQVGDSFGQMGDALPAIALGAGRSAAAIAVSSHACALLDDGSVKCWGPNTHGELGLGFTSAVYGVSATESGDALPPIALGSGRTAARVRVGPGKTCVILDDGSLKCWGWDEDNQVGDAKAPVQLYEPALDVAIGRAHVCALTASHLVRCWGHDDFGALGPTSASSLSGVLLGGDNTAQTIASTRDAMCAIRTDGAVVCWGDPTGGQTQVYLQGLVIPSVQPEQMPPGRHATELSGGRGHFCALLDDQSVACWGEGFWVEPIPIDFGPRHTCGNAALDQGEACDDGDLQAGDGCSESCSIEDGYSCSGAPSECRTTCGDYTLDRFEACELIDGGCDLTCHLMPGFAQVSFADLSGPGWGAVSPMVPYSTNGDVRVGDTSITNWGGSATLAADVCNDADVPYSVYPVIAWGRAPTPRDQTPLTLYPWQILSSGCVTAYLDFPINPSATGADLGVGVEVVAEDRDPSNNFRVVATLPIGAHCTITSAVLTGFGSIEAEVCNDGLSAATCVMESAISSDPASPSFDFSDPPTELFLAPGACDWYFGAGVSNPQGQLIGAVSATPSWQYLAGRAPPVLTNTLP